VFTLIIIDTHLGR